MSPYGLIRVLWLLIYQTQVAALNLAEASTFGKVLNTHSLLFSSCVVSENKICKLFDLSLAACIKECKQRTNCVLLTYKRRLKVCDLFSSTVHTVEQHGLCITITAGDFTAEGVCNGCQSGQFCNTKTQSCEYRECLQLPVIQNGRLLGNYLSVGAKYRILCDHGYSEKNGSQTTTCQEDGSWSTIPECLFVSRIGQTCSDHSDCNDANAACLQVMENQEKICMCKTSYQLSEFSGTCKVCLFYTSEYVVHQGVDTPGNDIDYYYGQTTFEECRLYCETQQGRNVLVLAVLNSPPYESCWCKNLSVQEYLLSGKTLALRSYVTMYERKCETE